MDVFTKHAHAFFDIDFEEDAVLRNFLHSKTFPPACWEMESLARLSISTDEPAWAHPIAVDVRLRLGELCPVGFPEGQKSSRGSGHFGPAPFALRQNRRHEAI